MLDTHFSLVSPTEDAVINLLCLPQSRHVWFYVFVGWKLGWCRVWGGPGPMRGPRSRGGAGRGGARAGEAPTPAQSRRGKPRPETWQICGTVLSVLICCVSCWLECVYFSSVLTSDLKVFPYVLKSFWPIRYMIFATSAN